MFPSQSLRAQRIPPCGRFFEIKLPLSGEWVSSFVSSSPWKMLKKEGLHSRAEKLSEESHGNEKTLRFRVFEQEMLKGNVKYRCQKWASIYFRRQSLDIIDKIRKHSRKTWEAEAGSMSSTSLFHLDSQTLPEHIVSTVQATSKFSCLEKSTNTKWPIIGTKVSVSTTMPGCK